MVWYDNTSTKSVVRQYESQEEMDRDIAAASSVGWRVLSVNEMSQRSGCLRICLIGFFALLWKPKSHYIVTFQHD